jgi:hypothetical protein
MRTPYPPHISIMISSQPHSSTLSISHTPPERLGDQHALQILLRPHMEGSSGLDLVGPLLHHTQCLDLDLDSLLAADMAIECVGNGLEECGKKF